MAWLCGDGVGGSVFRDWDDALESAREDAELRRWMAENGPGVETCDHHPYEALDDDGDGFQVCLHCQHGECSGCGGPVVETEHRLCYAWDEWCPSCGAEALTALAAAHGRAVALAVGRGGAAIVHVTNAVGLVRTLDRGVETPALYAARRQLDAAVRAAGDLTEGGTL